mgnify:CR=1 FL=1
MSAYHEVSPATLRRVIAASAIGNFVEWFDFAVYGFLATLIASQFFASEDASVALLKTFAVFAVAFALRPLGGLVFGARGRLRPLEGAVRADEVVAVGVGVFKAALRAGGDGVGHGEHGYAVVQGILGPGPCTNFSVEAGAWGAACRDLVQKRGHGAGTIHASGGISMESGLHTGAAACA